jgi:glutamate carboxypeptidase
MIKICLLFVFSLLLHSEARAIGPQSLDLLKRMVNINSHSDHLEGLNKLREILISEFKALGFKSSIIHLENGVENGRETGHKMLSFEVPGSSPGLLLVGHIDTVFSKNSKFQEFKVEGNRLFGPGIIDMKGGLAVMLEAISQLTKKERKLLKILINDDEEQASIYSKAKMDELARGIPYGLVFEPGLPDGSVVTSSSGGQWIELTVQGKAAHAGLEHQKGLNACTELAYKIIQLHGLTDYSRKLTLNIGTLSGGTQPNVVCDQATLKIDIRYLDPRDLEKVRKRILEISQNMKVKNQGLKPHSQILTLANVPSMPNERTQKVFQFAKRVAEKNQITLSGQHVGYATDGNHLSQLGMSVLVGLGPFGGGMHTDQEFMTIESFDERVNLTSLLMKEILFTFLERDL